MSACLAQLDAANDTRARVMLKCAVTVILEGGVRHKYPGIFPATADAIVDAYDRHGATVLMAMAVVRP